MAPFGRLRWACPPHLPAAALAPDPEGVATQTLRILGILKSADGTAIIEWQSGSGDAPRTTGPYTLEFSPDLPDPDWTPVTNLVPHAVWTGAPPSHSGFYRIQRE